MKVPLFENMLKTVLPQVCPSRHETGSEDQLQLDYKTLQQLNRNEPHLNVLQLQQQTFLGHYI